MTHTAASLKDLEFKGPVFYADGYAGMARQGFECTTEPRFGYCWERKDYKDKQGRQYFTVDGKEVANLEEAATLLNQIADPESPNEVMKRWHAEHDAAPRIGARSALSEARCNADAGPFGLVNAFMGRAGHSWHVGINKYSENCREDGTPWPRWLYHIKSATFEMSRLMYLWEHDRKEDTHLVCALGVRCRECPILKTIEQTLIEQRDNPKWPYDIWDKDIDTAKTLTCIGHVLTAKPDLHWEGILETKRDRESAETEVAMLAEMYGNDTESSEG